MSIREWDFFAPGPKDWRAVWYAATPARQFTKPAARLRRLREYERLVPSPTAESVATAWLERYQSERIRLGIVDRLDFNPHIARRPLPPSDPNTGWGDGSAWSNNIWTWDDVPRRAENRQIRVAVEAAA